VRLECLFRIRPLNLWVWGDCDVLVLSCGESKGTLFMVGEIAVLRLRFLGTKELDLEEVRRQLQILKIYGVCRVAIYLV
jgi:hypothetical protein